MDIKKIGDVIGSVGLDKPAKFSAELVVDSAPLQPVTTASKSVELKAIESLVDAAVPFDSFKVDSIKAAIALSEFKINPGDTADGIIMSSQDFLTTALASAND
jgi:anti-sigma28 factor (negative regulator of flagellin synthesis)